MSSPGLHQEPGGHLPPRPAVTLFDALHFVCTMRVEALLRAVRDQLSAGELAEVQHFIDHGEAGEGLRCLAWIIEEGKKRSSSAIKEAICQLLAPADLPPSFSQNEETA